MCTHPRDTPVCPTHTPSLLLRHNTSLLNEAAPGSVTRRQSRPWFQVWTHQPPLLQHTTVGAGLARETLTGWVFPELGDQPMGHTVPSDLAFQNPKLETTPSPPSGSSLPRCSQGTLSV